MSVKVNNMGCYAYIIKIIHHFIAVSLILDNGHSDPEILLVCGECLKKRGVGNTQFPCTRLWNHVISIVISIVISWFQQWFHDFYKDSRLQWFQISTLTALSTAWFLFTVMISRQISDFNRNFWFQYRFQYRFLSDFRDFYRFLALARCMGGVRFRISALISKQISDFWMQISADFNWFHHSVYKISTVASSSAVCDLAF